MLEYAEQSLDDVDEVKFVYADMQGNLKAVLNPSPEHRKSVFGFPTESEFSKHH